MKKPPVAPKQTLNSSKNEATSVVELVDNASDQIGIGNFMCMDDIMNESTKLKGSNKQSTGSKTILGDAKCMSDEEDVESVELGVSIRVGAPNSSGGAWTQAGVVPKQDKVEARLSKEEESLMRTKDDPMLNTGEADEESFIISPGKKYPLERPPPTLPSMNLQSPVTPHNAKSVLAQLQSEDATLAGLASGVFDADFQKLRTVSLPDLNEVNAKTEKITSLSDQEDDNVLGGSVYHTPLNASVSTKMETSSRPEDACLRDISLNSEQAEIVDNSNAAGNNSKVGVLGNSDEAELQENSSLGSEGEEYEELVRSLQSVLNHSEEDRYDTCSDYRFEPTPSEEERHSEGEEENSSGVNDADSSKNCSVRSQSPQFEDSCQDDCEFFGENDSVFSRLEQSREALEKRIGHEILLQAYNIIQVTAYYMSLHHMRYFCRLTTSYRLQLTICHYTT